MADNSDTFSVFKLIYLITYFTILAVLYWDTGYGDITIGAFIIISLNALWISLVIFGLMLVVLIILAEVF